MKPRILLSFLSYGPYHLARLNACREALPEWEVLGWELASGQSDYEWRHADADHVLSVTKERLERVGALQWLVRVWKHLNVLQPDVCVIAGYAHPGMLAALVWCCLHGRGRVIMSDSKEDDAVRRRWVEVGKKWLLSFYHAALVAGRPHRDYFIKLGLPDEVIHSGYDVVDNAAYEKPQPRPPVKNPYFLVISRFVPKKNLAVILAAYRRYVESAGADKAWSLVICGDGPLRGSLEQQISALGLSEQVSLPGFLQMQELLPFLSHAQALIHASVQEQWGLVVNEAMAAGLPVIVSKACGCFPDLVQEGVNGFGFNPGNEEELSRLMLRMHEMPESQRRAMGEEGRRWIGETHSLDHFAWGLKACVNLALAR